MTYDWNALNHLQIGRYAVSRDYDKPGQKSKPEWGMNLSRINLPLLTPYEFEKTIQKLVF